MREGKLLRVKLSTGKQQCVSQYANDSHFLIRGEKPFMDELMRLLGVFNLASRMKINWHKSCAHWFDQQTPIPAWTGTYHWTWAINTPRNTFWSKYHTTKIDQFLIHKISKKLDYWSTMKLSLAGRGVIVNQVLLSTLWFFIGVWGGYGKALRKFWSSLRSYLWSRKDQRSCTRVAWTRKRDHGLELIYP